MARRHGSAAQQQSRKTLLEKKIKDLESVLNTDVRSIKKSKSHSHFDASEGFVEINISDLNFAIAGLDFALESFKKAQNPNIKTD